MEYAPTKQAKIAETVRDLPDETRQAIADRGVTDEVATMLGRSAQARRSFQEMTPAEQRAILGLLDCSAAPGRLEAGAVAGSSSAQPTLPGGVAPGDRPSAVGPSVVSSQRLVAAETCSRSVIGFATRVAEVDGRNSDLDLTEFEDWHARLTRSERRTLRETFDSIDDQRHDEFLRLFTGDVNNELIFGGVQRLQTSDAGSLDDFLALDVGQSAKIRRSVAGVVGNEKAGAARSITPAKAYQFVDDVEALYQNPDVDGVEKVIDDDIAGTSAAKGGAANIKGGMFEVRATKYFVSNNDIGAGRTVKMQVELAGSIDIGEELSEQTKVDIIRDIELPNGKESSSGDTYADLTEDEQDLYDETFTEQAEFDTVAIEGPDGSQDWVYIESKAKKRIEREDIQEKLGRLKSMIYLSKKGKVTINGNEITIDSVEMRLATSNTNPKQSVVDVITDSVGQTGNDDTLIYDGDEIPWGE